MQSLRIKFGERRNEWRCCLCCHVRTGTIFYGMYHFILNLMALSGLAIMLRYPQYFTEEWNPVLPTPLSEIDDDKFFDLSALSKDFGRETPKPPMHYYRSFLPGTAREWNITVFINMCILALTMLLLYGAIKRKPSYMMPFFGFQVFQFCVGFMGVLTLLCNPPNFQEMLHQNNMYAPIGTKLEHVDPDTLAIYMVLLSLLVLMIKAYFIGVVWSCYKYLSLNRQVLNQRTIHLIDTTDTNRTLINDLPDYDTAVKKFPPTPPPSYATAVLGEGESSASAAVVQTSNAPSSAATAHQV